MDFLVIALPAEARLPAPAAEMIGGARRLADRTGGSVAAAVLGRGVAEVCREAVAMGAERVYCADHAALDGYDADAYLAALEAIVAEARPGAVLLPADLLGSELAPRLAHRLGTGAVTGCSDLDLSAAGELVLTRPVYGGKAMAEMVVATTPAIATVAPRSLEPLARDETRQAPIAAVDLPAVAAGRAKVVAVQQEGDVGVKLEDARVIVSGGRGLGEAGNFRYVEELAKVLGAGVGASRAAVDAGWVAPSLQVGQTGKSVAPDLYIAVGISGASQHIAGMRGARHVVVINRDPEAPFFKLAELGVAADYKQVLPPLTAKLRELLRG